MKKLEKIKYCLPAELYQELLKKENVEFIKVDKDVDVEGLKGINHYKIVIYYNQRHKDNIGEYWDVSSTVIDKFDYTWRDIEADGGIAQVNKDINECYGIVA